MKKKSKLEIPGEESLIPGYEWIVSNPDLLGGRHTNGPSESGKSFQPRSRPEAAMFANALGRERLNRTSAPKRVTTPEESRKSEG